jgi:hypothetical protein
MPKKTSRNKRGRPPVSTAARVKSHRIHSVNELLGRALPSLKRVTDQLARHGFWGDWLQAHVAAELRPRISGVTERDGILVIFAENAAWSARLRYQIGELEHDIRAADPAITRIEVRVLPRD